MNAAIRAVVRSALERGWSPVGISDGFSGLLAGTARPLRDRDVAGIVQRGGTVLGSARCAAMKTDDGRATALASIERMELEALVVIGGNGTHAGAHALAERGARVIAIGSTIDNDLAGCDVTIGATSALEVALEAIDRLKVTASSHHRAFLVEVMGRDCGYLAAMAAIAGGAEAVTIPEQPLDAAGVAAAIQLAYRRKKAHAMVVVAEGVPGGADELARQLVAQDLGFDVRVTQLGHVQRGAPPCAFDRLLGSRLGAAAVDALARGMRGVSIGIAGSVVREAPLAEVAHRTKPLDLAWLELAHTLAR